MSNHTLWPYKTSCWILSASFHCLFPQIFLCLPKCLGRSIVLCLSQGPSPGPARPSQHCLGALVVLCALQPWAPEQAEDSGAFPAQRRVVQFPPTNPGTPEAPEKCPLTNSFFLSLLLGCGRLDMFKNKAKGSPPFQS